jgi:hypothetical protein
MTRRRLLPRLVPLLALGAQACDRVVIDVERIAVHLESRAFVHPETGQHLLGCADSDRGVSNLGAVWVGLRREGSNWRWRCTLLQLDDPGRPETLPELEQHLHGEGFGPLAEGRWDVWILGYAADAGACLGSPQNNKQGRLCGYSAEFDIPTADRTVEVPVTCVPVLSVTAQHKVIESEVDRCFGTLFPP